MTHQEAVDFLRPAAIFSDRAEQWSDLGCGEGIFTHALTELLGDHSHVYAVDQRNSLVTRAESKVSIEFVKADFSSNTFSLSAQNGILLANSLHYIRDQHAMVEKIISWLKPEGRVIIIEYDLKTGNQWVPFPISISRLTDLFTSAGFSKIRKFNQRKSAYNNAMMYGAVLQNASPRIR